MDRQASRAAASIAAMLSGLILCPARAAEPLNFERAIPMPDVSGRIDHFAIDVRGRRLFVAALGNNSLEVIDLQQNKRIHTIRGLAEPQGIAYLASKNRVFVANRGDGSVRVFDASSWNLLRSIPYGQNADNVRIDPGNGNIWAGYGGGALSEIDPDGNKLAEIKVDAHPESFQLERSGPRLFVNLPRSRKIGVIDRKARSVIASWSTGGPLANFPMALDEPDRRLFLVTRMPARLIVLEAGQGKRVASLPAIGDCDDVFYDARRRRIYAIGGEGGITVFQQRDPDHYEEIGKVETVRGARTGFFSSDLDMLYVGVRQHDSEPAEIREYSPGP